MLAAQLEALQARVAELSARPDERDEGGRSFRPGVCRVCSADLDRAPHAETCSAAPPYRTHRLGLDEAGRRLDDLLARATERAWRTWAAQGHSFGGAR
jgi:hypothetical protein